MSSVFLIKITALANLNGVGNFLKVKSKVDETEGTNYKTEKHHYENLLKSRKTVIGYFEKKA